MGQELVCPQEIQAGGGVRVVLVLGRLLGLRLDVERPVEADLLLVIDGHVEEAAEVVELALHVGVEEGRIPLASSPESVPGPTQLVCNLHCLLDLRAGEREDVEVRAGRRAVHESRIRKKVGRPPEQLDPGPALLILEDLDDLVEIGVAFLEVVSFGGDVAIVEGVKRNAQFFEQLEGYLGDLLSIGDRMSSVVPGPECRTGAKRIRQRISKSVPVDDREPQVLLHRLPVDDLVGIVMLEVQRISRLGTAILDFRHIGEEL